LVFSAGTGVAFPPEERCADRGYRPYAKEGSSLSPAHPIFDIITLKGIEKNSFSAFSGREK